MSDPVSVLAFVLVGLKSAKLAHKVLTSFKDASGNVKSTTADVEGLISTLVGLPKCRALEEHGQVASSRRQKYKKRLMAIWKEKALTQMSAKMASHAANLNLCLNVLQKQYSAEIILLVKHGIDVYAEDHDGRAASDIAYAGPFCDNKDFGSAQGDVWDFALAACGYNISHFRQGRCCKARYVTNVYSRQDFEKLWEGQEHICLYYYDEENFPLDEESEPCSDKDSEKGWITTDSEDEGSDVVDLEEDAE